MYEMHTFDIHQRLAIASRIISVIMQIFVLFALDEK